MTRTLAVVALLLGLALPSAAQAGVRKGHDRTVYGLLESVDSAGKYITISVLNKKTNEMKNHRIKIDSNTKVLLNGQEAALSALPLGQSLTIAVSHGKAVQIQAMKQ
jgi:hypothetical protein